MDSGSAPVAGSMVYDRRRSEANIGSNRGPVQRMHSNLLLLIPVSPTNKNHENNTNNKTPHNTTHNSSDRSSRNGGLFSA